MNTPSINVTPLIDVLLVLLIIFMVVSPLKPSSFKARIPSKSNTSSSEIPHPHTLIAVIESNGTLKLNNEKDMGSIDDTAKLTERLRGVFDSRRANGQILDIFADAADRPTSDRIERTVFIKAPRTTGYGDVTKVIDAVKLAGAYPISLQIDDLP